MNWLRRFLSRGLEQRPINVGTQFDARHASRTLNYRTALKWHPALAHNPFANRGRFHARRHGKGFGPANRVARPSDGFDAHRDGLWALPNSMSIGIALAGRRAPKSAMAIKKRTRLDLGERLREAQRITGIQNKDVAVRFGVAPSTVSADWRKHGRIAKEHYRGLVEFFGLPYEWWFGTPAKLPQPPVRTSGRAPTAAVNMTGDETVELALTVDGMEITREALAVAKMWMELPPKDRGPIKRRIETLYELNREAAPDRTQQKRTTRKESTE